MTGATVARPIGRLHACRHHSERGHEDILHGSTVPLDPPPVNRGGATQASARSFSRGLDRSGAQRSAASLACCQGTSYTRTGCRNPFTVTGREDKHCELEIDQMLFRRLVEPKTGLIAKTAVVRAKRLTMENLTWDARGEFQSEGAADAAQIIESFGEAMREAVAALGHDLSQALTPAAR